jgi:hypothetical protein
MGLGPPQLRNPDVFFERRMINGVDCQESRIHQNDRQPD